MRLVELFVCLVVGVGGEVTESSGGSGSRAAGSTAFARCGSGGNLSHVQGNSSAVGADVELVAAACVYPVRAGRSTCQVALPLSEKAPRCMSWTPEGGVQEECALRDLQAAHDQRRRAVRCATAIALEN
ncbi:hypothetical protein PC110_g16136 [Phytophthora cactorum]|uniref:Secreted protein n=1 Tax=Phytophthora cactorum TaxID=29920 RepID=A0A329RSD9_9STRA|nr:hypothetical protein PC110_g21096 [Phytophthora cactorum]RAW27465.1 hypothetical protein PC110_g16136 [Phytophthora cactorum]